MVGDRPEGREGPEKREAWGWGATMVLRRGKGPEWREEWRWRVVKGGQHGRRVLREETCHEGREAWGGEGPAEREGL